MRPPKFVWFGPGWFTDPYWWRERNGIDVEVGNVRCNDTVMDDMVQGFFSADPLPISHSTEPTISGMVRNLVRVNLVV